MSTGQVLKQPAKNAAEFFANKNRKGFKKFNANLLDASAVSRDVYIDAPVLSSVVPPETIIESSSISQVPNTTWTNPSSSTGIMKPSSVAEHVRTLELTEDPDVVEKVQIEETKAQLAKAREGMERQQAAAAAAATPTALPASTRWVGARSGMRHHTNSSSSSSQHQGLDVGNAQLFPDLQASAKKTIMTTTAPQRPKPKLAPARTNKKKAAMPPMVKPTTIMVDDTTTTLPVMNEEKEKEEAPAEDVSPKEDPVVVVNVENSTPAVPKVAEAVVTTEPTAPGPSIVKKKKKDLSTFGKK